MFNLDILVVEDNYNPSFLNSMLKYPTKILLIAAKKFEIYSLDTDIYPYSVRNIDIIDITTYSFTL